MKINELKGNDIVVTSVNDDSENLTKEQKEIQEKFIKSAFYRRWKSIFNIIYTRMKKYDLTIEDLKEEINEKKSPFSKSQRDFVIGFKTEFLQQCINDLYKGPKAL